VDATLTAAMARSATGYAAVIDDILDIRTVTDNAETTLHLGLHTIGVYAVPLGPKADYDALLAAMPEYIKGRISVVEVSVARTQP